MSSWRHGGRTGVYARVASAQDGVALAANELTAAAAVAAAAAAEAETASHENRSNSRSKT